MFINYKTLAFGLCLLVATPVIGQVKVSSPGVGVKLYNISELFTGSAPFNLTVSSISGDGSGLTGIASGTGGVTNTGSTTVGADTDGNNIGDIAFQINGTTKWQIDNTRGFLWYDKDGVEPTLPGNLVKAGMVIDLDSVQIGFVQDGGFLGGPGNGGGYSTSDIQMNPGIYINRTTGNAAGPWGITWAQQDTGKWVIGNDYEGDDFVLLYDWKIPADVFRITHADTSVGVMDTDSTYRGTRFYMGGGGVGGASSQLSTLTVLGSRGFGLSGIKAITTGPENDLGNPNDGGAAYYAMRAQATGRAIGLKVSGDDSLAIYAQITGSDVTVPAIRVAGSSALASGSRFAADFNGAVTVTGEDHSRININADYSNKLGRLYAVGRLATESVVRIDGLTGMSSGYATLEVRNAASQNNGAAVKFVTDQTGGSDSLIVSGAGNIIQSAGMDTYWGAVTPAEGDWRIQRDGDDIRYQQLESSVWTTKNTISGASLPLVLFRFPGQPPWLIYVLNFFLYWLITDKVIAMIRKAQKLLKLKPRYVLGFASVFIIFAFFSDSNAQWDSGKTNDQIQSVVGMKLSNDKVIPYDSTDVTILGGTTKLHASRFALHVHTGQFANRGIIVNTTSGTTDAITVTGGAIDAGRFRLYGGDQNMIYRNGTVWTMQSSTTTNLALASQTTGNLLVLDGTNGLQYSKTSAGLTASTTQTQGQGALVSPINEVATVANANDTVTLPAAAAGAIVYIMNNGANTLQIFPASGDNLGAGVDTATTLAAGSNVRYVAYNATNWEAF